MTVLAAVDIGTNSIHLVVARVDAERFEVVDREREMVRLGSSARDMKRLTPAAMNRGIDVLSRFRQVAAIHGARLRAVATSAVREAENRLTFIERARDEAGVDIEVISGFEEARLIHLGVLQAVPVYDRQVLVCDIGGGSTELVVGRKGEVLTARSLKLGAIRLTRRYFPKDKLNGDAVEACRRDIRTTLAPAIREIERLGFDVAVGSSGTIGAVCQMVAVRTTGVAPRTLNNLTVRRDEIDDVVRRLVKAPTMKARTRIPGLDPRRADIILAGALILEQVAAECGVEELTFSDFALREGVLLDTWRREHGGSLHHLSDLRRRSVLRLAGQMDEDLTHSAQVARLALELFDVTCGVQGLGDDSRELLEAAALLANVGLFLSHAGHHKHSYYVIRNSELLSGFTDREIELIAQVARYHRKSLPRPKHAEFAALDAEDRHRVRVLAGLLRIAVGLDRNHAGLVRGVSCRPDDGGAIVIEVRPAPRADVSLELHAANQRTDLLAEALGRPVKVVLAETESVAALASPEAMAGG
ncbi:MAG TPA: Ppx/GppA phosphatase family protein [Acidimicrobiales bacterium]|jgi:exopolyphosphatase/guanosine-5'-triphosphate,3'-diphosphate pyrophosphatase|nr:Ppx/GppA phosphatase family protein [Acidimicrobiales bacterium]